jgi:ribonuclease-3
MDECKSLKDLQKDIDYLFHDEKLLEEALTRRMHLNDIHDKESGFMNPLATVGDAVLGTAVIYRLYESGSNRKTSEYLTNDRSSRVNRSKTRAAAEKIGLDSYVQWGEGERKKVIWTEGDKAFDTAFEALIGAVFLDARRNGSDGLAVVDQVLDRIHFF